MRRLACLLFCAALAAAPVIPAMRGDALCAERSAASAAPAAQTTPTAKDKATGKPARKAKGHGRGAVAKTSARATSERAKAAVRAATTAGRKADDDAGLTRRELLTPYTAGGAPKAPASEPAWASQNATQWFFDTSPQAKPLGPRKKAPAPEDSAINLHVGPDKRTDPLTGEELKRRLDNGNAVGDLKNLDLKGALDKVGGKAEVQVDILKF